MNIKHDELLQHLRSFGFHLDEHTSEGFLRYSRRIGNLIITICNQQFENKIRISMLQDREGHLRVAHKDILAYTELIGAMQEAGLVGSHDLNTYIQEHIDSIPSSYDMSENPLISFPKKPVGFMAQ